jgi:hypothetical protein
MCRAFLRANDGGVTAQCVGRRCMDEMKVLKQRNILQFAIVEHAEFEFIFFPPWNRI